MSTIELQQQALTNALSNTSARNYPDIFRGFLDKGIPESDIRPRENVFTFHAWKALGRKVKKGEHGIGICTFVAMDGTKETTDPATGETVPKPVTWKSPRRTTVFHVSQTESIG